MSPDSTVPADRTDDLEDGDITVDDQEEHAGAGGAADGSSPTAGLAEDAQPADAPAEPEDVEPDETAEPEDVATGQDETTAWREAWADEDPYPQRAEASTEPDEPAEQADHAEADEAAENTDENTDEDTTGQPATRSEDELRTMLGLEPAGWRLPEAVRVNGWIVTAAVAAVAALTRLLNLSHPRTLMFDEIYYAKDAYALWHNGYESSWSEGADELFATGDVSALTTDPSYIVHPQLGKWLIGLGMEVFGVNSLGWRIVPAIAGILTVIVLTRLTLRLTRSPLLAGLAGLLLAIDGVAITESRIALLDGFIGLFGLLTLYCLVRDRQWSRARLARDLAGTPPNHLAPRAHLRPWLLAAGVCLGLTCSIKWSGLYLLAAVGILVVVWDTLALRRVRAKAWFLEGVIARGFGDFLRLVPVALVVYVAGWCSWFAHDKAYKHGWAATEEATHGSVARSWLPDPLNDLVEYHLTMYDFHVNLSSEHPYMASPFGWLLQLRPTSFYWPDAETLEGTACPTDHCIQAITSIGNIAVWWAALPALVLAVAGLAWRRRDWRVWVPLIAYVGLYLPWFGYLDRTIFTFYTVAFAPAVVLVLTLVLGSASGMLRPVPGGREAREEARLLEGGLIGEGKAHPRGPIAGYLGFGQHPTRLRIPEAWSGVPPWRIHTEGIVLTAVIVAAALVFAALWWPIWTGQTVTYEFWHWHMLLPSWI